MKTTLDRQPIDWLRDVARDKGWQDLLITDEGYVLIARWTIDGKQYAEAKRYKRIGNLLRYFFGFSPDQRTKQLLKISLASHNHRE